MKFAVKSPIQKSKKIYKEGEEIDLPEEMGKLLTSQGIVVPIPGTIKKTKGQIEEGE